MKKFHIKNYEIDKMYTEGKKNISFHFCRHNQKTIAMLWDVVIVMECKNISTAWYEINMLSRQ
jgi:hypothetical protein